MRPWRRGSTDCAQAGRARAQGPSRPWRRCSTRGIHPIVPRHGSIGAADLCLLAHIGLVVGGEGEAELDGRRMTGAEALTNGRSSHLPGCG